MAVIADKVVVELELKDGQYLARVRRNEEQFTRSQRNTARAAEDAERRIRASSDGISRTFRSLATSFAAGASVAAITRMADGYTSLQNRLKATGLEGENLIKIENDLFDAANKNGIAVDAVAQLYQRASLAQKSLGASNDQLIDLTNGVAAALRVQGVSATQASGPLLQLGQALGAGTVRAEELNSLLEGTPILLQAAANGSKRFGGDINALSKSIRDGKVSSQELFRALLEGLPEIEKQAESLPKTVGQALQILNNQLGRYVGQTDKSLSATARLAGGIESLSNNLESVVPALATIAGLFATRYVASLAAASVAETGFITRARQATAEAIANERAKTAAVAAGTRARTAALTAESIALRRQVDTGRNATGQFISQANAQRQLSETNRALAASLGPATVATVRNTRAVTLATTGAKALGSGLVALAGGPIGATILAVAALSAGIIYLNNTFSEGAVTQRKLDEQTKRTASAFEEYEKAAQAAAKATGEAKKAADEYAETKRELYYIAIQNAQALAEETAQIAAQRAEMAKLAAQEALSGRPSREAGEVIGQLAFAGGSENEATRAAEQAEEAAKAYEKSLENLFDLQQRIRDGFKVSGLEGPKEKGKGKTAEQLAKEAEQRARLLVDLERQTKIEEAQLAQDAARVRELEREAEIVERVRRLKDAGFKASVAEETSSRIQLRIDAAREKNLERIADLQQRNTDLTVAQINENIEVIRSIERQVEYEALVEAHKESSLTLTEAQERATADIAVIDEARANAAEKYLRQQSASHAIRIAELTGQTKLANSLKDQEAILQRTNELRAQGLISIESARRQAEQEVASERSATRYGEQRDFFASTFSEGVRAALSGDLNGFLASQFGNLADMALKKLGESLFDSATEAPAAIAQAQAEGVAQGAAISIQVSAAMTTAGGVAASAMGAAILSSGTTVAGLIAQANSVGAATSGFNPFGGFRAGGGGVRAGFSYDVGENGRERFVAPANGYIIPNMKNATAKAGMSGMVKIVVGEGEMFTARVTEIAGPLSIQTAATSAAYSQDQMVKSQKRSGQRIF